MCGVGSVVPGFRRFWAADAVSMLGDAVTLISLQTLVVLTLDGTAQDVGWLNGARWLPYLVLGLAVGAWVDRWPRRPLMVGTDLLRAALLCAIPLAWWAGALTLPLLLATVLLLGVTALVGDAASQSFITRLVPREHLQPAHARLDTGGAVAQTSGPAVGGGLVSLVGAPVAILLDAASFVFSAAVVATLRVEEPRRPAPPDRPPHLVHEIREGVRWVYGDSGLARLAASTHVWFVAQGVLGVVVAPFALLVLDLSPLELGIAVACGGGGALAGALVTSAVGRRVGTGGAVIGAHLLSVAGALVMACAGLGAAPAVVVLAAGQVVHGLGMGISNSHEMAFRQVLTPDHLQARTNTTMRSLNRAVLVVGAPAAGFLVGVVGSRPTLVVAAVVFALSAGLLLFSPFRSARTTVAD